jgi:glycosyltransferase involved in cell wall biosynthesis
VTRAADRAAPVPGVLMVTGVYYPEVSGASLQGRTLIAAFGDRARCRVLTTTSDRSLMRNTEVDGIAVRRVLIDLGRPATKITGAVAMASAFLRDAPSFQIVHLHGFSQKSALLMILARVLGKRTVVKMSSLGHDDPVSFRRRHPLLYRLFARADRLVSIGPAFTAAAAEARLPLGRVVSIPNGVDVARFSPATPERRLAARRDLDLPPEIPVVLCVAFFSAEKRQEALFDAWLDSRTAAGDIALVFAGATRSASGEVDGTIAERIVARARELGLAGRLRLVEHASEIERLYDAADVFVLPSSREGAPNVVLEAMACGLPTIVSRLPGVTDALIDDGQNGILVDVDDRRALAGAIATVLGDRELAHRLAARARETAERRFGIERVAEQYLNMYRGLICVA